MFGVGELKNPIATEDARVLIMYAIRRGKVLFKEFIRERIRLNEVKWEENSVLSKKMLCF